MRKRGLILLVLLMVECHLVSTIEGKLPEKQESTIPIPTNSPPEGNTTFLGGTTWCVARPGVSQADLQNALDWACGLGKANCDPIQYGGSCFEPDTLLSHASYAFNNYYQQNGNSDIACNFGGTATVVTRDPSYGNCAFSTSESLSTSSTPSLSRLSSRWWEQIGILLILYMRS
ncbi:hypothetical protein NE237_000682 [Protea cynaroides]|uniref:X8 domain-containing protein n=1 Tax=Protea cynaroides TaxID=273540 RepID=A0A9Q0KSQ1_9MAGN|nr:hypothetical protein NE237_000682 [Protea cynaroides]